MTPAQARQEWLRRRDLERGIVEAQQRARGLELWYDAIEAKWPGPCAGPQEEDWEPEARAYLALSVTERRQYRRERAGAPSPGGRP